jgi:hypothetical protein
VFRRHLEAQCEAVETLGFAGFFAVPIAIKGLGNTKAVPQCPVLLPAIYTVKQSTLSEKKDKELVLRRGLIAHVRRAWKAFKMGAISCFSFIGPVGLIFLPKLLGDMLGLTLPGGNLKGKQFPKIKNKPVYIEGLSETDQIALAEGALKAMSLTRHFARLVMITGHSSTTINNPHRAGLDCGACGGQSGEANARLLAQILNEANIRIALKNKGINIPEDTIFLACEHDTCTDDIIIFNSDIITQTHSEEFKHLKHILAKASVDARAERALRLGSDANIIRRSRDWSQVRPEWGLAGCTAFVVAPRYRTQHLNMSSSTFMHSYNWQTDDGFKVLELIMTAPMVVTNWINMQYYASMVDQKIWGSGNKTLHNVVGNVGVIEGNAGDIRSGLPIQSLHDGQDWQHEPLRLAVYIEAPKSAVLDIISQHELLQNLCNNVWLSLYLINDDGRIDSQYKSGSFVAIN